MNFISSISIELQIYGLKLVSLRTYGCTGSTQSVDVLTGLFRLSPVYTTSRLTVDAGLTRSGRLSSTASPSPPTEMPSLPTLLICSLQSPPTGLPSTATNSSHCLLQTPVSFLTGFYATDYTTDIEEAPSHQSFYGATLHRLDLHLLVTAGSTVQECCVARVSHEVFTTASLSHYAVSSIDGSSQSRICSLPDLLVASTIVQECGPARFTNSIIAAFLSHYAVSSIDGSSQSQLCDLHTGVDIWRPTHPKDFYRLSDVCSHTLWLNESGDCLLRSSVITYWARHGNVEFRVLDPVKSSALSSNLISSSASIEVKLEHEIHLVFSISFVGFKADHICLRAKSSQIGLCSLNSVYGSGASHLKFLPIIIPTSSHRCFNVVFVFDYQLFFGTIAMGTKVKLLFGFFHFAERDSPLDGSFSSYVLFSSFFLLSSRTPEPYSLSLL